MKQITYKNENGLRYFSIYEVWGLSRKTEEFVTISRFLSKEEAEKDKELDKKAFSKLYSSFGISEVIVWAN